MSNKWKIEDQDELKHNITAFVLAIKNTPRGNDPEIIKLLDQLENEYDMPKHYAILAEIIMKAFGNEGE